MKINHTRTRRVIAAILAASLAWPGMAFAEVRIDDTALQEGENSVGGGVATYLQSNLDLMGVTAGKVTTDEDLTVNFNGNNDIDTFETTGNANVEVNFSGQNEVEDIEAYDNSNLTVNVNGHDDLEDIEAYDNSNLTVNVSGNGSCEAIKGYDDADVTVQGTSGPCKDKLEVGEGESSERIGTERGNLTIKDVQLIMSSKQSKIVSKEGNVSITRSRVKAGSDNERIDIHAGGKMLIDTSTIDIKGDVTSEGFMTIRRSILDAVPADDDDGPYRVWSRTGIELIDQYNGEVKKGELDDDDVYYVDTDDDDEVHLRGEGAPTCKSDDDSDKHLPATADPTSLMAAASLAVAGAGLVVCGRKRR